MPGMSCTCTDVMMATCDLPEVSYAPIAVCAVLMVWIWQRYMEEEEEEEEKEATAPTEMYN